MHIPGAKEFSIPVKPIDLFLSKWDLLIEKTLASTQQDNTFHLAIVGAGAGGIEMALSNQYRLDNILKNKSIDSNKLVIDIYCDSETILPDHNSQVRKCFNRILKQRNINVHTNQRITKVEPSLLITANEKKYPANAVLWVTNASAPTWLANTGLQVDENGFIAVNDSLQSISHPEVFAAGDIAAVLNHPRPKSGVFAVRQGMPLAKNLAYAIQNKKLIPFKPQNNFLGLISTGDKYAIASRSNWSLQGAWLWKVKDWIDRKFMDSFNKLPEMKPENMPQYHQSMTDKKTISELSNIAMRCGGCGAKVDSTILSRVIKRLTPVNRNDVIIGLADPDDAAVTEVPNGKLVVQSIDYFRSFIDDPYIFGQIAANHALSDIFAMGAEPQTAMAVATIPFGIENQIEEQLFQTMSGALNILNASNTALVGGHSSEGVELSFGLSVSGLVDKEQLMRKSGMQQGDVLILTKALGTGTLFAADMQFKAKGRWIDNAVKSMLLSNQAAGICLHKHGASACTDITGFGLLGHLIEMAQSSNKNIEINLSSLPILDGAHETTAKGIFSSLQEKNSQLHQDIEDIGSFSKHENYPFLFDPQTSGGLAASIPINNAKECIAELREQGYSKSIIIGRVCNTSKGMATITLSD